MVEFAPTAEQLQALDGFAQGGNLVLEAGAGTGKTSTLRLLAESAPDTRFLYLAYNRAIAQDAKGSFGRNADCYTAHAFAMRHLRASAGAEVKSLMGRLNHPRMPSSKLVNWLRIREAFRVDEHTMLQPGTLARLAREMVTRWCYSPDPEITTAHVPQVEGLDRGASQELAGMLLPWARRIWRDAISTGGELRTEHDHYLKVFAMSERTWDYDVVALDEAQDSNPCVAGMVSNQVDLGKRVVVVGDSSQAIYGWRAAVDAMNMFPADHRVQLSQSFRFGPAIAEEANKWLTVLGGTMRLRGTETIRSRVDDHVAKADAVLCRSNAEVMLHLMRHHDERIPTAVVGGGREVRQLAEAAGELKARGQTWHPDLCAFTSWGAVQDYVEQDGGDLKALVSLVDTYGATEIVQAIDQSVDESVAETVVSTAHKAKGREWRTVRVADDFTDPGESDVDSAEAMLAYVTVTRAKERLGRGSLAWVDHVVKERPPASTNPAARGADKTTAGTRVAAATPRDDLQPGLFSDSTPASVPPPATTGPEGRPGGDDRLRRTITLDLPTRVWTFLEDWAVATGKLPVEVMSEALGTLVAVSTEAAAEDGELWYQGQEAPKGKATQEGQP